MATRQSRSAKRKTDEEATTTHEACSICLDNDLCGRDVSVLPCGHTFHASCIMTNVISTGSLQCPNCRATIVPAEKPSEEESDAESDSSTEEQIEHIAGRLLRKLSREDAISLLRNKFKVPKRLEARTNQALFEMLAEQIICETDDEED